MNVFISPNIKRISERIDTAGNIIDARTKQVLKSNTPEYVPTDEEVAARNPVANTVQEVPLNAPQAPTLNAMTIQQQIDEAKQNVAKLEELKKLKIAQMKAELELLEN